MVHDSNRNLNKILYSLTFALRTCIQGQGKVEIPVVLCSKCCKRSRAEKRFTMYARRTHTFKTGFIADCAGLFQWWRDIHCIFASGDTHCVKGVMIPQSQNSSEQSYKYQRHGAASDLDELISLIGTDRIFQRERPSNVALLLVRLWLKSGEDCGLREENRCGRTGTDSNCSLKLNQTLMSQCFFRLILFLTGLTWWKFLITRKFKVRHCWGINIQ